MRFLNDVMAAWLNVRLVLLAISESPWNTLLGALRRRGGLNVRAVDSARVSNSLESRERYRAQRVAKAWRDLR